MTDEAVALLDRLREARTSEEREAAARAVREYVGKPQNGTWNEVRAKALSTGAWRDAIIDAARVSNTDGERRWVCEAICAITRCADGRRVFGTEDVRDVLVAMARAAGTDEARKWIAAAMNNITHGDNADGLRVFCTEGVRDALVAMARAAGTDDAREEIAEAVCYVTRGNTEGAIIFNTAEMRRMLETLRTQTKSTIAVVCVDTALQYLDEADKIRDDDADCVAFLGAADAAFEHMCPGVEGRVTAFFTCVIHNDTRLRAVVRQPTASWCICNGNKGRCRAAMCDVCRRATAASGQWRCTCDARVLPSPAPTGIVNLFLSIAPECPRGCGARVPLRDAPTHVCASAASKPKRARSDQRQ